MLIVVDVNSGRVLGRRTVSVGDNVEIAHLKCERQAVFVTFIVDGFSGFGIRLQYCPQLVRIGSSGKSTQ